MKKIPKKKLYDIKKIKLCYHLFDLEMIHKVRLIDHLSFYILNYNFIKKKRKEKESPIYIFIY